eukprot:1156970-Pelagomonas_calceolata.AAC.1
MGEVTYRKDEVMNTLGMPDAIMSEEYEQSLNEKGGDKPRWKVPHDVPAAYGGLVSRDRRWPIALYSV